uniref:Cytochrome b6-f complex subunit 7 n=1 Tax=Caloglossa monosticha TaxID=76906 RepID=A0A1Z1M5K0_9FLOR|nr:cytochrome b6-f complex subunit 7 [Caloglossa monosticha]ARW61065.1 cytochrome b6-f complex subunit 7 [Caloglossa monosticha]
MIYEILIAAIISFVLIILGLFLGFLLLKVQGE